VTKTAHHTHTHRFHSQNNQSPNCGQGKSQEIWQNLLWSNMT